jgi:hypothetical protein
VAIVFNGRHEKHFQLAKFSCFSKHLKNTSQKRVLQEQFDAETNKPLMKNGEGASLFLVVLFFFH